MEERHEAVASRTPMSLIDVTCLSCDTVSEVYRASADYPATPPCPKCDGPTQQIHLPPRARSTAPAVTVFRMPDGTYRYPGDPNGLSAKGYEQAGATRLDLRGWAEVRTFESQVNRSERARIEQRIERQEVAMAEGAALRRSDLFHRMKTMSPRARDLARALIARNNQKGGPRSYDPGFRVEVYSEGRSNRDASRDPQGRRRSD
jgi:hypothetical protein